MNNLDILNDIEKVIVETDEENPITIVEIDADNINVLQGYRVRLLPKRYTLDSLTEV